MADKDETAKKSNDSFMGRNPDPELEQKVDTYMQADRPKPPDTSPESVSQPENKSAPDASGGQTASAPLLPSDKLPNLEPATPFKKKAAGEKIQVIDHSDDRTAPEVKKTEPESPAPDGPAVEPIKPPDNSESLPNEPPAEPADDLGLEDVGMGKAVDEIVAAEADQVLAAEDQTRSLNAASASAQAGGHRNFLSSMLHSKRFWKIAIGIVLIAIIAAAILPSSRYLALNTLGVRASTSMTVLDEKTSQPLKNAELSISGKSAKTNAEGFVKIEDIKLGPQNMTVKKPAFGEINRQIIIGWGSNPQAEFRLTPVGSQYTFTVTDFLSGKPVNKAEASSGEASARANEKGEITLTVPDTEKEEIEVKIGAQSYRTDTLIVPAATKENRKHLLVPARKHAFISKRTGTYDVYKIDVDGKNEEKVLGGTGSERQETMALVAHPSKNITALVSTREGLRTRDGVTLSTLTLINLEKNDVSRITQSERIQVVDWSRDRLVYVKIAEGATADDTKRHRLMSYDIVNEDETELASTNYFNDVLAAKESVYFSPAVHKVNGSVGLFSVNPDGSNRKTIYSKEVWNLFRSSYDEISVSAGQDWFKLNLGSDAFEEAGPPPVQRSRVYADSPDDSRSLWIDERDGKGVLLSYDKKSRQEKTVSAHSGLKNPIRWLSNQHAVYRVTNSQETADYVVNLDGGEPRKIRDVTNTAGVDQQYYY